MGTKLDQILARTLLSVTARKAAAGMAEMERRAAARTPRGFERGLRAAAKNGPAVIAELKKASPSKGLLRADFRPVPVAKSFEAVGAAALSVLTDEEFFQGSVEDLSAVSAAVTIPVLRKDFMIDPYQIVEARAYGADAILLIVAAHTDAGLRELSSVAAEMGLDVLCEVHDAEELKRAVGLGFTAIGVNSRNLKTLEVDLRVHEELVRAMPANAVRVAESGIHSREDVERLSGVGYDAFLIGEALMRQPDPAAMLGLLLGAV